MPARIPIMLAASLLLAAAAPAFAGDLELKTFDAAWRAVDHDFYDPDHGGLDWDEVGERYRPLAQSADSSEAVHGVINSMLAELGASHTSLVDGDVYRGMMAELNNKRTWTFGLLIEETLRGRYFVRASYEGGPGAAARLKAGDRIVEVDGEPIEDSPYLMDAGYDPALPGRPLFFLRAEQGAELALTVQPTADSESRFETSIAASRMNAVDAAARSVRVVEREGRKIGTLHLWYCSRGVSDVLREAIAGKLKDCDALVLDVRGRGGYTDVVTELLKLLQPWRKPLVVLIDERSRSAKEVLAYKVRQKKLGTLVGQRTEGAVLGAVFRALPDGSYLELAGVPVPVDGHSLEGVGVAPDVEVDFVLPYARGRDPIFEKGVEIAADRAQRAARKRPI